jgi:hypothetical protein
MRLTFGPDPNRGIAWSPDGTPRVLGRSRRRREPPLAAPRTPSASCPWSAESRTCCSRPSVLPRCRDLVAPFARNNAPGTGSSSLPRMPASCPGYERGLAQAVESIRLCAALKRAQAEQLVAAFRQVRPPYRRTQIAIGRGCPGPDPIFGHFTTGLLVQHATADVSPALRVEQTNAGGVQSIGGATRPDRSRPARLERDGALDDATVREAWWLRGEEPPGHNRTRGRRQQAGGLLAGWRAAGGPVVSRRRRPFPTGATGESVRRLVGRRYKCVQTVIHLRHANNSQYRR